MKELTDNMLTLNLKEAEQVLDGINDDIVFLYLQSPLKKEDIKDLKEKQKSQLELILSLSNELTKRENLS